MKILILVLLCGCASIQKPLAEAVVPAFRAEATLMGVLSDLDEQKLAAARSKEEVEDWQAKYVKIRQALELFHSALSTVAAFLLTGK